VPGLEIGVFSVSTWGRALAGRHDESLDVQSRGALVEGTRRARKYDIHSSMWATMQLVDGPEETAVRPCSNIETC
jgi:hypothetical protein